MNMYNIFMIVIYSIVLLVGVFVIESFISKVENKQYVKPSKWVVVSYIILVLVFIIRSVIRK